MSTRAIDDIGGGSSPRSWGCFIFAEVLGIHFEVFPTLVGVFLSGVGIRWGLTGLPHARGGVSTKLRMTGGSMRSSPRSWGCFQFEDVFKRGKKVFPTLVGVFPGLAGP